MSDFRFERPMKPGLVSIVTPTRRGEAYIGATLETIGRQEYDQWELIVVEDGSTGPTERIVEDFAKRYPDNRVDYSRNDRSYGAAATRNKAFAKAAGQYIALLDSDDRWFPDHLAVSVAALQSSGKDIVYSSVVMIEDKTEMILGTWGPQGDDLEKFPISILGRSFVTPSASVMRREVIADVGAWTLGLTYCEDYDFWLRCIHEQKTFQYVGGVHCLYRKNHQGATTSKLCGTLEEVAEVTERRMLLPGLNERSCRRRTSKAYLTAARLHASMDPAWDPSADRSRVAGLYFKAWQLRREHVDYLWMAVKASVKERLSRKKASPVAPPTPTAQEPQPNAAPVAPSRVAA
jgi:glycosyltransferase involved in cell wall biosynthesis